MAADLDAQVEAFRTRPLDQGPYTLVAADALVLTVREDGRVANVHALVAVGVNGDGHREILGLNVTSAEDGAGWLGFFRDPRYHRPAEPERDRSGQALRWSLSWARCGWRWLPRHTHPGVVRPRRGGRPSRRGGSRRASRACDPAA